MLTFAGAITQGGQASCQHAQPQNWSQYTCSGKLKRWYTRWNNENFRDSVS